MAVGEHVGVGISLGNALRSLRLESGCSLDEMAQVTRISVGQLRALEAGNFDALPAPVFVKGFIRAYCEFLGAPPGEALSLYRTVLGRTVAAGSRSSSARSRASWLSHPIVLSAMLFASFGGGLLALDVSSRDAARRAAERAVAADHAGPASPALAALAATPVSGNEASSGSLQRLVVRALEATSIRIETDDGRVATETLPAGATREWTSGKGFVLAADNAGGIQVELNGRSLPPLGARGAMIRRLSLPEPQSGS